MPDIRTCSSNAVVLNLGSANNSKGSAAYLGVRADSQGIKIKNIETIFK